MGIDGLPGPPPSEEALGFQFLVNELSDDLEEHIRITWDRICGSYVNRSGEQLERAQECELQIVTDVSTMVAEIVPDHSTGRSVLRISTGTVLLLDIVSTVFNIGFRLKPEMLRWESSYFSNDILNLIGVPHYLTYFSHYLSTGSNAEKDSWCYACEYSLEWILRHEFGHSLLGHVGYLANASEDPILSEHAITAQFSPDEISYGSSLPLVRYSAELLADSYATISMFLDCLRGYQFEGSDLVRGNRCNVLCHSFVITGMSMIVPMIVLQLPEIIDWRNRGKHENSTHPKVISRLIGAISSLAYILDPPHDVRNDPFGFDVRKTIDDVYEEIPWHLTVHSSLNSCIEVTLRTLAANGLLGNDTKEEYEAGLENLHLRTFSSVVLGRFAAALPAAPESNKSDAQRIIEESYDEWVQIYQLTGAKFCGFFINHFDHSVLKDGHINDPTYFILNEWLGKAQLSEMGITEFYGYTIEQEKRRAEGLFRLIKKHSQNISF